MAANQTARRYRFGAFEADGATGELRKSGLRIRLHAQPFQVLLLLLERPGELLTREQIAEALWPSGTFVDYEHGVNSAINRLREALGDSAGSPRFIETLARKGYRFVAPVSSLDGVAGNGYQQREAKEEVDEPSRQESIEPTQAGSPLFDRILAAPHELPKIPAPVSRRLFLLFQLMYLSFYIGALVNLPEIDELLSPLAHARQVVIVLIVTAAVLIPVRAFAFITVLLRAPAARRQFLSLWIFLLPLDVLWALSPFLLLHHIHYGVAICCMALLAYAPFVQRSLVLMGACDAKLSMD